MKMKLTALVTLFSMLAAPAALAYDRTESGYRSAEAEEEETPLPRDFEDKSIEEIERDIYRRQHEEGEVHGPGGTIIGGYVLLALGGVTAIAGSTIIAATDHNVLGVSLAGGGAALSLAGTLMITLGSHGGYAVGPSVDPKRGAYGVVLAKKF